MRGSASVSSPPTLPACDSRLRQRVLGVMCVGSASSSMATPPACLLSFSATSTEDACVDQHQYLLLLLLSVTLVYVSVCSASCVCARPRRAWRHFRSVVYPFSSQHGRGSASVPSLSLCQVTTAAHASCRTPTHPQHFHNILHNTPTIGGAAHARPSLPNRLAHSASAAQPGTPAQPHAGRIGGIHIPAPVIMRPRYGLNRCHQGTQAG